MLRRLALLAPFGLAACGLDASGTGDGLIIRNDSHTELDTEPVVVVDSIVPPEDAIFVTEDTAPPPEASPDTPLPGCTTDARAGHTYMFCELAANWDQARTSCQLAGYDLVIVNDKAEHDWLVSILKTKAREPWHIGLNDRATEGSFKWIDGSSPGFTSWGTWEPNDFFGEDCTVMTKSGAWNDVKCATGSPREAFICETP